MKSLICLLFASMMSTVATLTAATWNVGEPFPTLTLPPVSGGDSLSLTDFQGEKVVLHVFASW